MKTALFCRTPLGDGIYSLFFAEILHKNGIAIDIYHDHLGELQSWVPHLPILPYPDLSKLEEVLFSYDLLFVVWDRNTPFSQQLILQGKKRCPEKIKVFYFYPSKNVMREPYYKDTLVNPLQTVRKNYEHFAKNILGLPQTVETIHWQIPKDLTFQKNALQVAIHPTGSGPKSTHWPQQKFLKVAKELEERGLQAIFVPGIRDFSDWQNLGFTVKSCPNLLELGALLYESKYFLGSDSGPGHFASSLGIPSLTLCRRGTLAKLWAPAFAPNITVTPPSLIPNVRWFRLRDRYWKSFLTPSQVSRRFQKNLIIQKN